MMSCPTGSSRAGVSETERLAALRRYRVLDTPPEETFDRITRIVKTVLDMPMVAVALIDETRHWLKSKQGPLARELPRDLTFCNETIRHDAPLVIPDASRDPRWADAPLVAGEPHLRFYAGVPLRTAQGHAVGTLCCLDVTPRTLAADQLAVLGDLAHVVVDELELRLVAATDHLTGIMGRRAFRAAAERDLEAALRGDTPLGCIVFDIDLFKRVNDTFGHVAGDAVLKNVARLCDTLLHGVGYIGRMGGEEFAVILPGLDLKRATRVAEALREAIEALATDCPGGRIDVTISAGVAAVGDDTRTLDALIMQADSAVYAAKRAGRNLCVRCDEIAFVDRAWAHVA